MKDANIDSGFAAEGFQPLTIIMMIHVRLDDGCWTYTKFNFLERSQFDPAKYLYHSRVFGTRVPKNKKTRFGAWGLRVVRKPM